MPGRNGFYPARKKVQSIAALIRSGQAHSPRVADAAGQKQFEFDRREETGLHLPWCEMTGVTSDVHLVVCGDGSGTVAKLLGPEPRFVLQKVTRLSVPVTVLCRNSGTLSLSKGALRHRQPIGDRAKAAAEKRSRRDAPGVVSPGF